jgi:hypothetical protein
MIVGWLCIALLLQTAAPPAPVAAPSSGDTTRVAAPDSTVRRDSASTAPGGLAPVFDARLMPNARYAVLQDTLRKRRRAVSYSDAYYTRLQIHRYGSYVELPVFAAEWWLGNKLTSTDEIPGSWVKPTHATVAGVLGALFTVNTVTGVWNLYESRHDTEDRALVWSHSALMLASDAGFAITGLLADNAKRSTRDANRHRDAALVSMGLGTAGTVLMWAVRGF